MRLSLPLGTPEVAGAALDPATSAWLSAVITNGGSVSSAKQTNINDFIAGCKADALWSQLDRAWTFCLENRQAAQVDMVALAIATESNSPTFTANRGYTGNGSNMSLDTGFNPSSTPGRQYAQNSAMHCAWCNTSGADGTSAFRALYGTVNFDAMYIPNDGGSYFTCINDTGSNNASQASPGETGLWLVTRNNSTTFDIHRNGSLLISPNIGSTAPLNNTFKVLTCGGLGFSTRQIAFFATGKGLSSSDATNFYNRVSTLMTALQT